MIGYTLPEIRRLLVSLIQAYSPDPDKPGPGRDGVGDASTRPGCFTTGNAATQHDAPPARPAAPAPSPAPGRPATPDPDYRTMRVSWPGHAKSHLQGGLSSRVLEALDTPIVPVQRAPFALPFQKRPIYQRIEAKASPGWALRQGQIWKVIGCTNPFLFPRYRARLCNIAGKHSAFPGYVPLAGQMRFPGSFGGRLGGSCCLRRVGFDVVPVCPIRPGLPVCPVMMWPHCARRTGGCGWCWRTRTPRSRSWRTGSRGWSA